MSLLAKAQRVASGRQAGSIASVYAADLDELRELVSAWARGSISAVQFVVALEGNPPPSNPSSRANILIVASTKRLIVEGSSLVASTKRLIVEGSSPFDDGDEA